MEFAEASDDFMAMDAPTAAPADEHSVLEAAARLEAFLKGQGYLPMGGKLTILNAGVEAASHLVDLLFRLASQQQQDDRAREMMRDQADKDRVALAAAQKRIESLEDANKRLSAQVKELDGKLLASKHKAEEQERELKQKLQSTTNRLNGYLYGGRDAGKRNAAPGGGSSGATGAGGARRSAPAFDRFRDDPMEATAATQKLEAELAQLKQVNMRLKKELAAARVQPGSGSGSGMGGRGSGGSPLRDGRREDQRRMEAGLYGDDSHADLDMQSVRHALMAEARRSVDSASARFAAGLRPASPDGEVARLQRLVRDLQANVEHLHRSKQDLERQLSRTVTEKSEMHKTLHTLRSKCASLEVERRNAEDRFLRAQRANASLLDPAASEAQLLELRDKLAVTERELQEAKERAEGLQRQLASAEADVESNQRHVEVLKRAIRVLPKGQAALEEIQRLVEEELRPLQDRLREAVAELAEARAQREMEAACASARTAETGSEAEAVLSARDTADLGGSERGSPLKNLPLSPTIPLPASPGFDGFAPAPASLTDSPPPLQPLPAHGAYNRGFAVSFPSTNSELRSVCS
ncbi:hypothetical protein Agub_g2143, partial [Astrephomene gubernaculifera]